ncbi:MAG: efflux RND transporter periplasmic adaptor subunit [Sedimentisphaerales bacterium]|jgi:HlyD family secretion protein
MSGSGPNILQTQIYHLTAGRRKWLITGGFAIALVLLTIMLSANKNTAPTPEKAANTFKVCKDNLIITVTENGSIKARNAIHIKSDVEGQVRITSIVPEGNYITPQDVNNKVLVELDSSTLTENLSQRQIDFAGAESSFAEANEAYFIQLKQNESDITAAELKVEFALMDLKKYLGDAVAEKLIFAVVNDPNAKRNLASILEDPNKLGKSQASQKLTDLQDKIEIAGSELARAEYRLEGTRQLYDANYVATTELQEDELKKRSCEIENKQSGINLDLFKLYDFPKDAEKFLSDYYEAGRELDRTHARCRSKLAQTIAQLKSAEARFDLEKERLEKLKKQIDACVIKAPGPGLVVYASSGVAYWYRDRPIEVGYMVQQNEEIMSLPDTSEMIVEITVHESSITKIKPGQIAKITIDAFPDRTFTGKVLKISPLPDQQRSWLNPDLKVYTTQVIIDGSYDFLKPGMSAKVETTVEELNDVIIVPIQAVANRGGKKVCYYVSAKGPQPREVQTGSFNEKFVQITDGLQVGEDVLMNPPLIVEPAIAKTDASKQQKIPLADKTSQKKAGTQQKDLSSSASDTNKPGGQQHKLPEEKAGKNKGDLQSADHNDGSAGNS